MRAEQQLVVLSVTHSSSESSDLCAIQADLSGLDTADVSDLCQSVLDDCG